MRRLKQVHLVGSAAWAGIRDQEEARLHSLPMHWELAEQQADHSQQAKRLDMHDPPLSVGVLLHNGQGQR